MKASLNSRLLKILMAMLLVSGGITIGSSYLDAEEEIQELFDAELARSARLLLSLSQAGFDKVNVSELQNYLQENKLQDDLITESEDSSAGHSYEKKILFQIFANGHDKMCFNTFDQMLAVVYFFKFNDEMKSSIALMPSAAVFAF